MQTDPASEYNDDDGTNPLSGMQLPDRDVIAIGLAMLIGGVASVHKSGIAGTIRSVIGRRRIDPANDPRRATVRAWARLERDLERHYDSRQTGEPVRRYISRLDREHEIDEGIDEIVDVYERARYSDVPVDTDTARAVRATVDEIVGGMRRRPER